MEIVIDVFKNRPGKSIGSLIVVMVSVVTLLMFQELKVETLNEFFDYLTNNPDSSGMFLTWMFNLITFVFMVLMGILWIKEVVEDNYMDISPEMGRLVSLVVGILHLVYSVVFLNYIFSNLLGIVLAVIIVLLLVYGSASENRRRRN